MSKQAIMWASRELIEAVWPDGHGMTMIGDVLGARYEGLKKALRLPADCKITGVSMHLDFQRDLLAIRVGSPEFIETPFACTLPEVEAIYGGEPGNPVWLGWRGSAVGIKAEPGKPITFRELP